MLANDNTFITPPVSALPAWHTLFYVGVLMLMVMLIVFLQLNLLEEAAKFRSKGRLPSLVWMNKEQGNFMLRSAQPQPGIYGKVRGSRGSERTKRGRKRRDSIDEKLHIGSVCMCVDMFLYCSIRFKMNS